MRNRQQITAIQLAIVIYLIAIGTIYFPAAGIVVPLAGTAGWMAITIAFLIGLLWVGLAVLLCHWAPSGNFTEAVFTWFGSWVGRGLLVYLLAIGVWLGSLLMLQGSLVFHAIALPATPPLALTLSTLILIVWTDLKGIEVYLRTVQLLFFLGAPLIAGLLFGTIPLADLGRLLPLFGKGPVGLAKATYQALPWAMDGTIFTLFLGSMVSDKERLGRWTVLPILAAGLSLAGFVLLTIAELGIGVAESFVYPTAQLALSSRLGGFLQGLELFFYPLWLVTTYIKSTAFFVLASECLCGFLPPLRQPWRALLLGAAYLAISRMPQNINEMAGSIARVNNSVVAAFYWLLPLLLILAWWRRRKRSAKAS